MLKHRHHLHMRIAENHDCKTMTVNPFSALWYVTLGTCLHLVISYEVPDILLGTNTRLHQPSDFFFVTTFDNVLRPS